MAITNSYTSVLPEIIPAGSTAQVTLGLSAAPSLVGQPADIVLVLEADQTVEGIQEEMKEGARRLVERITTATGGGKYDLFGNGVRMALVIYNDQAITSIAMTNESIQMDAGITSLPANTTGINQAAAITMATDLLKDSTGRKAIILFTYHQATTGGDAVAEAKAARDAGIEIFGLGPETRRADLTRWVGAPKDYYLCINVGGEPMTRNFEMVADRITAPDTNGADVKSTLGPGFEILRVVSASAGTARIQDPKTLIWQAGPLGLTGPESATAVYEIRHTGTALGKQFATAENLLTRAFRPWQTRRSPSLPLQRRRGDLRPRRGAGPGGGAGPRLRRRRAGQSGERGPGFSGPGGPGGLHPEGHLPRQAGGGDGTAGGAGRPEHRPLQRSEAPAAARPHRHCLRGRRGPLHPVLRA